MCTIYITSMVMQNILEESKTRCYYMGPVMLCTQYDCPLIWPL